MGGWGRRFLKASVIMSMDSELQKHYAQLLGVGSPWEVKAVELKLAERKVEIELGWQWGAAAKCPVCGRECSIHDCAPERTWRHLDTMQFTTLIRARTPRSDCPEHGVKTMQVPWAAPQGRFRLSFERFAVEVLLAIPTYWLRTGLGGDNWCCSNPISIPCASGVHIDKMATCWLGGGLKVFWPVRDGGAGLLIQALPAVFLLAGDKEDLLIGARFAKPGLVEAGNLAPAANRRGQQAEKGDIPALVAAAAARLLAEDHNVLVELP